ncbi:MAG: hypothetical protein ACO1NN_07625 [Sphingopyxis sp.]
MATALTIYGQDKLAPDVRAAALEAAHAALSREGVTAAEAVAAYGVDLLLAEGLSLEERTDARFREHGASLRATEAYCAAREAAEGEIARRGARFAVLFSVAN